MSNLINHTCIKCNKVFQRYKTQSGKYCSKQCRIEHSPKTILKNCEYCLKEFKVFLFQIEQGNGKFCSKKCFGLNSLKQINRECLYCKKSFSLPPSKIKKGYGKHCSDECRLEDQNALKNFFNKVEKKGSGCWEWTGCKGKTGYGKLHVNGKFAAAHRVSWELKNGKINNNFHVLHKCDNPPCVNPDHLFLGTHQDNMNDMMQKKRNVSFSGESHHKAKLNEEQVKIIYRRSNNGECNVLLANEFNVDPVTISHIKVGRTWKHITDSMEIY